MTSVILAGNGISANILYAYLSRDTRYKVLGVTADDEHLAKGGVEELVVVGLSRLRETFPPHVCRVIMAVGYSDLNRGRESMFCRVKEMGYAIESYVHPEARVYSGHPLGEGCVILPGAVIEPYAQVGTNTVVWCNASIAHHSTLADHCWIATGTVVSGQAKVMRNTFIGVNATVVNGVTVGEYNIVGASCLISRDTKAYAVHLARSAELFRVSSEDYVKHFKGLV